MEEKKMKSNGADSRSSTLKRQRLLSVAAVLLICCLVFVGAAGAVECAGGDTCNHNASVGSKHYDTIGEAISNWGNNQVLTLLADVTLSDVVQLKSTDNHTLNLGTYTMTAANGKNAIEITPNGVGTDAKPCLTIDADSDSPGGITATGKACIYYCNPNKINDRLMVTINGGVFAGSYAINSLSGPVNNFGFCTSPLRGQGAPYYVINGGTFNAKVNLNAAMLKVTGGTFNQGITCLGDSTAYRKISGGTFKSWSVTAGPNDAMNQKFWIGNSDNRENYNLGVYIDKDGYLVVGGLAITSHLDTNGDYVFTAHNTDYKITGFTNYEVSAPHPLTYSSAAANGLYYKDIATALKSAQYKGTITLFGTYADNFNVANEMSLTLDITDDEASLTSTVTLGTGASKFIIKYNNGAEVTWNVLRKDGQELKGSVSEPDEDSVVTHTYENNVAIITFDTNGGDNIPSIELVCGESVVAPVDPNKEGHTFEGWYSDDAYLNKYEFSTPVTEDLTLYANWTINQYTITFVTDGGSTVESITQEYNTAVTAPADPTKIGYTFAGWDKTIPTTMPANDLTITASWTANTSTVHFDANGGEGTMADQPFTYDEESKALTPNAFTRDGYTFNGWNTVSSGSGIAYSDKQNVRNLTAVNGGTVTLYAQWKENPQTPVVTPDDNKPNRVPTTTTPKTTYKVTFYPNGGSGEMNAVTFVEGEQKAIPVNIFTREGYTFKGWALTPGGEVFYTDGESVLIDGATSLYAVWEEVSLEKPEEPTDDPSDKPTEPATPAPILTVLAGLGAAVLSRRK